MIASYIFRRNRYKLNLEIIMLFFIIGVVIALLAGYIIIGLLRLVFAIIGAIFSWLFGS